MSRFIAERRLWYSKKGDDVRNRLIVGVCPPVLATTEELGYPADGVTSKYRVEFDRLSEYSFEVFGVDSVQAIHLASDLESILQRLSGTFEFFWDTGEPYFED